MQIVTFCQGKSKKIKRLSFMRKSKFEDNLIRFNKEEGWNYCFITNLKNKSVNAYIFAIF